MCFSQKQNDSLFRKYEDRASGHNHIFYILALNPSASAEIKNAASLSAVRKLAENVFIIEKDKLNDIEINKSFINKLVPANNQWKLSPAAEILEMFPGDLQTIHRFTAGLRSKAFVDDLCTKHPLLKQNISVLPEQNIMSILTGYDQIQKLFLNDDRVIFIDVLTAKPKAELAIAGFDLSANKINAVHSQYPLINGLGQHASIKEDYYDTTDIDLKGRYDRSPLASKNISNHANFIATIIAGGGNSTWYSKGAAWGASISSSSFEQVLPDPDSVYLQQAISVQNHSYGTIVDNNYSLNAMAFDKSSNNNEDLLHVFSSGNQGNTASSNGRYSGITGFANITGNFKMAKNSILVGSVDSFGNVVPLSSRGPAYDGRIKPDLVAFQKNGTSEAAALVSGTVLLLQQYYRQLHPGSLLPSALVKAILINSADDVNNAGPDYATGFGNMNAIKAMDLIKDHHIISGLITQGATQSFSINVPANAAMLKVTLAWNDTAASPLIPKALVNDIDLEVAVPAGTTLKPWVLSPIANVDSLNSLPTRKRDSLNNIEEVTIEMPSPGSYQLNIKSFNLPTGFQKYYVVYSWDTFNVFKWRRPTSMDFVLGASQNILRWNSFTGKGDLEYSYGSNVTWLPLASNIDLSDGYSYWNTPDTVSRAVLRMKSSNTYFYSDTFLITTLLNPRVGLICNDSILVYWNKIESADQYQLYRLGEKYMEPILMVGDTSALVSKNMLADKFIAVAPILRGGITATKSYAFDYTLQGTGCYVNAFLAEATDDNATLALTLGTLYQLVSISFEKLAASGFVTIFSPILSNQLQYTYDYQPLSKGITYFRAKITLADGRIIYSPVQSVFYVERGKYLLLPVPARRNSDISLYTTLPSAETFSVWDVMGRMVIRKEILFAHEIIKTSLLQPGEYFYRISKDGLKVYSGKFIIL